MLNGSKQRSGVPDWNKTGHCAVFRGPKALARRLLPSGPRDFSHETDMATKTTFRFAAAALVAGAAFASAAQAGDFSNASTYNAPFGMQPGQENQPPNTSLRDANGNLTVVNGQFTSSSFGTASGAAASGSGVGMASSGAGTSGASSTMGAATAIGNQLNVVTLGNNNTVVINATQNNSGNQTATNTINGH
jgi:holdfast attachment protein HfaA